MGKQAAAAPTPDRVIDLERELADAHAREAAMRDLLRVISGSPSDVQPVFEAVADAALRLTGADVVAIWRGERDRLVVVAERRHPAVSIGSSGPLDRSFVSAVAYTERRTLHVPDVREKPELVQGEPLSRLAVPITTPTSAFGTLFLAYMEARPFTQRQIELVETFAEQAAIAIENARLVKETSEALERQTAIAEILRVISGSQTDVQPVVNTIAESAARYCGADEAGVVILREDGSAVVTGTHDGKAVPPVVPPIAARWVTARAMSEARVFNVADMEALSEDEFADGIAYAREHGYRAFLAAPLLKDGRAVGAIQLRRAKPGAFAPSEVDLVRTFADQAVIAIENVRLFNETKEALDRQTAIAEILRVMSSSPTDVQPVLEAIAESARRFCVAEDAVVGLIENGVYNARAHAGPMLPIRGLFVVDRTTVTTRAVLDKRTVHTADIQAESDEYPVGSEVARRTGQRATMATPMLREGEAIGAILIRRSEPRPFTERQAELLRTFADQAVIAIENVRLFNETREALEQQTAISEVLQSISGSPTDVLPVLGTISRNAALLCDAQYAGVMLLENGRLIPHQAHPDGTVTRATEGFPLEGSVSGRAIRERRAIHVEDLSASDEYPVTKASRDRSAARQGTDARTRTVLAVPMMRQDKALGTIFLRRAEVRPFSRREVALVETFASQAVIAIENVRLFNATKEGLERQTAISEILRVISGSPTDVQPVLDAVASSARRFCQAEDASVVLRREGDILDFVAHDGPLPGKSGDDQWPMDRSSVTGRSMIERRLIHVHDLLAEPEEEYPIGKAQARQYGHRTTLAVPLLREGRPLGALLLRRGEVRPFNDAQLDLVRTFADQAAIAIENVRLFNETKEALEQQTATAEVLKVISRSAFDLQPVLDAVVQTAGRLARADITWMRRVDSNGYLRPALGAGAHWSTTPELDERYRRSLGSLPVGAQPSADTVMGRALAERRTLHIEDLESRDDLLGSHVALGVGGRTVLAVPMFRQGDPLGFLVIVRVSVRPFSEREIQLVETFADQAAIAIENVRLFNRPRRLLRSRPLYGTSSRRPRALRSTSDRSWRSSRNTREVSARPITLGSVGSPKVRTCCSTPTRVHPTTFVRRSAPYVRCRGSVR